MGTSGAIIFGTDQCVWMGSDGGPWALGFSAVENRLEVEELMKKHGLSFKQACSLKWAEEMRGYDVLGYCDEGEWVYVLTEEGVEVIHAWENKKWNLSLDELKLFKDGHELEEFLEKTPPQN